MNSRFIRFLRSDSFWILFVGSSFVLLLWFAYANLNLDRRVEKWGVFGDKFGALNTLFTGLAFVGLLATLWHERESNEQRENETKALMACLDRTAGALERQAEMSEHAQYIALLRTQLDAAEEIVKRLHHTGEGRPVVGVTEKVMRMRVSAISRRDALALELGAAVERVRASYVSKNPMPASEES